MDAELSVISAQFRATPGIEVPFEFNPSENTHFLVV
jgi:hypothetical protein